jgi:DNA-binding transcriptional ArsR family regulator
VLDLGQAELLEDRRHVVAEAPAQAGGGRSVQEIADALPISRPAVSRHLRLLKDAGLVSDQAVGTRHVYELRAEGVEAIREYFAEVWGEAVTRFRIVAENTDER